MTPWKDHTMIFAVVLCVIQRGFCCCCCCLLTSGKLLIRNYRRKMNLGFVWNFYIKRVTTVTEVSCGVHWHNSKCIILIQHVVQQHNFIIYHKIFIIAPLSQTSFTDRLWNIHKILNYIYLSSSNNRVRGILYLKI